LAGSVGSVPPTVSRQHCSLTPLEDGSGYVLKNLKVENTTYVNGVEVQSKRVTTADKVELGGARYELDWSFLKGILQETVDISKLRVIWEAYESQQMAQQIADRKFNVLRSSTGIVTLTAAAASFITGRNPYLIILYVSAVLITLGFTIKAYRDSTKVPQKLAAFKKNFQKRYVCPNCNHFFGFQPFDVLKQNGACPYCKTKFKK